MTRPRKLLLWLVVLPVFFVALVVGLLFLPAVQTFAVRRALATRPDIKAEVQEVAVTLGGARLRGLRYEQPGLLVTAPSFEADVSLLDLVKKKVDLRKLVIRDVSVVYDPVAAAAADATPSAGSGPASSFAGLLKAVALPPGLRAEGVDLAGAIRVLGAEPVDATFTLKGGGVASGAEGAFTLTLNASAKKGKLVGELQLRPSLGADGQLSAIKAVLSATAESAELAAPAKLDTELTITRDGAGEAYRLRIANGAAPLVELTSAWAPGATQTPGHWSVAVTDTDLKPFLLGVALPVFQAKGEGELTATAADRFRVGGKLNVAADSLERLDGVPALGPVNADLRFGFEMNAGVPRVEALSLTVAGAAPVLSVEVRQPFGFDLATRKLLPSRPGADLCDIVVLGLPVAWLKSYVPAGITVGGPITGAWVVRAEGESFAASASTPLLVPGLRVDSAAAEPQFVFDAVRVEGSRARFGPDGLTAGIERIRLQRKGEEVVSVSAIEVVRHAVGPLTAKGELRAALTVLTAQPALVGASRLSAGLATASFTVSQGDTLSATALMSLVGLRAGSAGELPEITLNAAISRRADGVLTLKLPITVHNNTPARSSELELAAMLTPKDGQMQIDARLTSKVLQVPDLQAFSALAPEAKPAPVPTPAPVPPTKPLWAGFGGELAMSFDRVVYLPGVELTDISGKVALTPDTLSFSGLKAALGKGRINLGGSLKFVGPAGYGLVAEVAVQDLESGPLLRALSSTPSAPLEGVFSLDTKLAGQGIDPAAAARAASGEVNLSGKKGVIRALNFETNRYARAGSAVAGLASLAGALSGNSAISQKAAQVSALNSVARLLGQLNFDELTLTAKRGANGELAIGNLSLRSPLLSATGSGAIGNLMGRGFVDQPLTLGLTLGARGEIADSLRTLGLLAAPAADATADAYLPLTDPLSFDGSLREVGTKQATRLLARALSL
jgi:AsmA family